MSKGQYGTLLTVFRRYRADYGGYIQILSSPFFHASVLLGFVNWLSPGIVWQDAVIAAFPTVLGFSLAAYTLTFAFTGSDLHSSLVSAVHPKSGVTLFRMMNASFFHIVFLQTVILIYANASKSTFLWFLLIEHRWLGDSGKLVLEVMQSADKFVGSTLMYYGLSLMVGVAISMFRLGTISKKKVEPPMPPLGSTEGSPPSE